MFGKILLPIQTRRAIKHGPAATSVGYSEAQEIGLVFKYQDDKHYAKILEFSERLEADNKEVSLLVFWGRDVDLSKYSFPNFSASNLSAWGKLTSEEIDLFLGKKFDFLIDLDMDPHDFIDNILSRSHAKCKIGRYVALREMFYQLMIHIDPSDDFDSFLDKVYHYIKNLRADA